MLCFPRLVIPLPQSFPFSKLRLHSDERLHWQLEAGRQGQVAYPDLTQ